MIVPNAQTPRVTSGTGFFSLLIRLTATRQQTLEQGIFWSFASDLHIWHLQEGGSQSVMDNCQHAERENVNRSFPTETQQKGRGSNRTTSYRQIIPSCGYWLIYGIYVGVTLLQNRLQGQVGGDPPIKSIQKKEIFFFSLPVFSKSSFLL